MALKQSGRKVPNFIEDFKTLADGRFTHGSYDCPTDWSFALHNLAFDLHDLFGLY